MKKIIGLIVVTIFVVLVIGFGAAKIYSDYQTERKQTTITEFENSEIGYRVQFQEIGEPSLFGPSEVRIVLKNGNGKKLHQIETYISNDGKNLSDENISVMWEETQVIVILDGEEQQEKFYAIEY